MYYEWLSRGIANDSYLADPEMAQCTAMPLNYGFCTYIAGWNPATSEAVPVAKRVGRYYLYAARAIGYVRYSIDAVRNGVCNDPINWSPWAPNPVHAYLARGGAGINIGQFETNWKQWMTSSRSTWTMPIISCPPVTVRPLIGLDGAWTFPQGAGANWAYLPAHGQHLKVNFGSNDGSALTLAFLPGERQYVDPRTVQLYRRTWGVRN